MNGNLLISGFLGVAASETLGKGFYVRSGIGMSAYLMSEGLQNFVMDPLLKDIPINAAVSYAVSLVAKSLFIASALRLSNVQPYETRLADKSKLVLPLRTLAAVVGACILIGQGVQLGGNALLNAAFKV